MVTIEFDELYARHLCRHSQFGINVAHLVALFGVWFAVYSVIYWLARMAGMSEAAALWIPVGMAAAYLAVVAVNVPMRVAAATTLFLVGLLAAVLGLPELPVWVYLLTIPIWYKVQSWSHRVYNVERDMTEFQQKYSKGYVLFVVLLFYEVPIVLNYLLFAGDSSGRAASATR
jgi:hypothetical protein